MAPKADQKHRGRVERITFHNPDNGYTVAKVRLPGNNELMTMVGPMFGIAEGQEVEVQGRACLHPKFGPQLEVDTCRIMEPSDAEGVKRYLSSGLIKGCGPMLAQRIVDALGADAIEIILNEPEKLRAVSGVGPKKAKSIAKAVADHGMLREAMIFLQSHGVGASTAMRIYKHYGSKTRFVLENEPHSLAADIHGIGFATADQIAAKLGIAEDHPSRLAAGIIYTLQKATEQGHCYLPYDELIAQAAELLQTDRQVLGPSFADLHQKRRLVMDDVDGQRAVYLGGMLRLEQTAAACAAGLARGAGMLDAGRAASAVQWAAGQMDIKPSAAQAQALEDLLTAPLGVLTGGPGTGKTTLVRAIVAIALRLGLTVEMAAPTGRAAKRMSETSSHPAKTLHRLLEFSPKENRFQRGPDMPLQCDLLIVDEASMIDIWLGAHLLEAIAEPTRLLLVGDVNQLPPVGPGLMLRQIIESGAATVAHLREIFRQKGGGLIVENAHRILGGQMPNLPVAGAEADFYFIENNDAPLCAAEITDLVARRLPGKFGFDPVDDIQVLAPMHKGNLGCQNLNNLLRDRLNPGAPQARFAPGDKVMQVRNNYDLEVFNGDVGRVISDDGEECRVNLDGKAVSYSPMERADLVLAYAVTIHKSQGSEYPAVIVALANEHFVMLNRPLIYTAVTRGRKLVLVVGNKQALRRAVEHDQPVRRYAALHRRLSALMSKRNITLIGMPGVGKSYWGKKIASSLGWRFIDGDDAIEQYAHMGVQEYLDKRGRAAYIELESNIVMGMDLSQPTVISPGGSVIYSPQAMQWLRSRSVVVFLDDDLDKIKARIDNLDSRGVVGLAEAGNLENLWQQRRELYLRHKHFIIDLPSDPDPVAAIVRRVKTSDHQ